MARGTQTPPLKTSCVVLSSKVTLSQLWPNQLRLQPLGLVAELRGPVGWSSHTGGTGLENPRGSHEVGGGPQCGEDQPGTVLPRGAGAVEGSPGVHACAHIWAPEPTRSQMRLAWEAAPTELSSASPKEVRLLCCFG